jgi:hypothetical protein
LVATYPIPNNTTDKTIFASGPVWIEGIENIGKEKNAGKEYECSGKTEEWKTQERDWRECLECRNSCYRNLYKDLGY